MNSFISFVGNNRFSFLRTSLVVFFSFLGVEHSSFADKGWCLEGRANRPCGGAAGKCVMNPDGTKGGFIANTATRQKRKRLLSIIAKPYIGLEAEVCGHSTLGPDVRIYGKSIITDSKLEGKIRVFDNANINFSIISGKVKISNSARVFRSNIKGTEEQSENFESENGIKIYDDANIEDSQILDDAHIGGKTKIVGSTVKGNAHVFGEAMVQDTSVISSKSSVGGKAIITMSQIYGEARIYGDAKIKGSEIYEKATVYGNAEVNDAFVKGQAQIYGNGRVTEMSVISGNAQVFGNGVARGAVSGGTQITVPMPEPVIAPKIEIPRAKVFKEKPFTDPLSPSCEETLRKNFLDSFKKTSNIEETFEVLRKIAQISRIQGKEKGEIEVLVNHFCKEENSQCPICYETILMGASLLPCEHLFCHSCFEKSETVSRDQMRRMDCPLCRKGVDPRKVLNVIKPSDRK